MGEAIERSRRRTRASALGLVPASSGNGNGAGAPLPPTAAEAPPIAEVGEQVRFTEAEVAQLDAAAADIDEVHRKLGKLAVRAAGLLREAQAGLATCGRAEQSALTVFSSLLRAKGIELDNQRTTRRWHVDLDAFTVTRTA